MRTGGFGFCFFFKKKLFVTDAGDWSGMIGWVASRTGSRISSPPVRAHRDRRTQSIRDDRRDRSSSGDPVCVCFFWGGQSVERKKKTSDLSLSLSPIQIYIYTHTRIDAYVRVRDRSSSGDPAFVFWQSVERKKKRRHPIFFSKASYSSLFY
jgi:hypothetical protein